MLKTGGLCPSMNGEGASFIRSTWPPQPLRETAFVSRHFAPASLFLEVSLRFVSSLTIFFGIPFPFDFGEVFHDVIVELKRPRTEVASFSPTTE